MDASPAGVGKLALTLRVPIGSRRGDLAVQLPAQPRRAQGRARARRGLRGRAEACIADAALGTAPRRARGGGRASAGLAQRRLRAGGEIGDVLVEDERVKLITFTGSARSGWRIRERAARKRVNLELGNATPVIVGRRRGPRRRCRRGSPQTRSPSRARAASRFSGSTSSAGVRHLPRAVPAPRRGPGGRRSRRRGTEVGPVIAESERDRVLAWIAEATAAGARVLTGGKLDGDLLRADCDRRRARDAKVSCEEVFGPLCTVTPYDTLDEAIALANSTRYGLQAGSLHARREVGTACGPGARVRRGDRERGTDVPRRSDAVRWGQGLGQHARGPGVRGAGDDGGAARRAPALRPSRAMCSRFRCGTNRRYARPQTNAGPGYVVPPRRGS